jgi:flavodoxin
MKTAVIYYSLEGNMEYIANKIASNDGADLYRIIPEKAFPTGKVSKYFWCGKSATFGERPKLVNMEIDFSKYDTVIIGSPIWAGSITPPVHSFLHDNKISGKKIILVAAHSGGGGEKCFAKMSEFLKDNTIIGKFEFLNPLLLKDESTNQKIQEIRQLMTSDK